MGDLALHLVASGVTPEQLLEDPAGVDLPDSLIGFLHGELGTPPGGFPEPFRTRATEGRSWSPTHKDHTEADEEGLATDRRATLNRLLFPTPSASQAEKLDRYGDLSVLPSPLFWYGLDSREEDTAVVLGRGVRLLLGLRSISEPNDEGIRIVGFRVNGQHRDIDTLDSAVASDRPEHARADPTEPGQVAAPFRGAVNVSVAVGHPHREGQPPDAGRGAAPRIRRPPHSRRGHRRARPPAPAPRADPHLGPGTRDGPLGRHRRRPRHQGLLL